MDLIVIFQNGEDRSTERYPNAIIIPQIGSYIDTEISNRNKAGIVKKVVYLPNRKPDGEIWVTVECCKIP